MFNHLITPKNTTNKRYSLLVVVLFCFVIIQAQTSYPVPPKNSKMLFYLQRTFNRNTIVYELNSLADGKLNIENPIKAYWIRYEDDGRTAELSYIQRKVYGVKCVPIDKTNSSFSLTFSNFNRRKITLSKESNGSYKAFISINNQKTELESVFIKSEKNVLGIITYKYIDLSGVSTVTGKKTTERMML